MSQLTGILVIILCCILGACSNAESAPEVAPPVSSALPIEPEEDLVNPYPVYERLTELCLSYGESRQDVFTLNEEGRLTLWPLLRVNEWIVATDLPFFSGSGNGIYFTANDMAWWVERFDDKTIIIPSDINGNGEKICFYAPDGVRDAVLAFAEILAQENDNPATEMQYNRIKNSATSNEDDMALIY